MTNYCPPLFKSFKSRKSANLPNRGLRVITESVSLFSAFVSYISPALWHCVSWINKAVYRAQISEKLWYLAQPHRVTFVELQNTKCLEFLARIQTPFLQLYLFLLHGCFNVLILNWKHFLSIRLQQSSTKLCLTIARNGKEWRVISPTYII